MLAFTSSPRKNRLLVVKKDPDSCPIKRSLTQPKLKRPTILPKAVNAWTSSVIKNQYWVKTCEKIMYFFPSDKEYSLKRILQRVDMLNEEMIKKNITPGTISMPVYGGHSWECDMCGNKEYFHTTGQGVVVCCGDRNGLNCGYEVANINIDYGPLFRKFEGEPDKNGYGPCHDLHMSSEFNTSITEPQSIVNISFGNKENFTTTQYKDRNKIRAFSKIDRTVSAMVTVNQLVAIRAKDYYTMVRNHFHRMNTDVNAMACILLAMIDIRKEEGTPKIIRICKTCDPYGEHGFFTDMDYRNHLELYHLFKCIDCKEGFDSQEDLDKHDQTMHWCKKFVTPVKPKKEDYEPIHTWNNVEQVRDWINKKSEQLMVEQGKDILHNFSTVVCENLAKMMGNENDQTVGQVFLGMTTFEMLGMSQYGDYDKIPKHDRDAVNEIRNLIRANNNLRKLIDEEKQCENRDRIRRIQEEAYINRFHGGNASMLRRVPDFRRNYSSPF